MEQNRAEKLLEIREWLTLDMQEGISKVILGKQEEWRSQHLSLNDVKTYVLSKGAYDLQKFDCNGWSWDAWENVKIDCKVYIIGASGYFGGVYFERYEDDDEDDEPLDEEDIENIKDWM